MIEEDEEFIILGDISETERQELERQNYERTDQFYKLNKRYEIGKWYQELKEFTAPSYSITLTYHEAYILHAIYYDEKISPEDEQILTSLTERISDWIKEHENSQNEGFFMKLSTRSPKDYCWDYRKQGQVMRAGEKLVKWLQENDVNEKSDMKHINTLLYRFFLTEGREKIRVKNGRDFIQIFSKSERVITDINDFSYLHGNIFGSIKEGNYEKAKQPITEIWIREWRDYQWYEEFRVFYFDYKLTAISQYDEKCYFPQIQGKRNEITEGIQQIFNKMEPHLRKLQLSEGVMDIMVKEKCIELIQINIYNKNARASLFNWEEDKDLLKEGPLTIRIIEQECFITKAELASMMGMIDKQTENVILYSFGKLGLEWRD